MQSINNLLDQITLHPNDENAFGDTAIKLIERSSDLHNNNTLLKQFIVDTITHYQQEIEYSLIYQDIVYHPNVALSRTYEIYVYQQILEKL